METKTEYFTDSDTLQILQQIQETQEDLEYLYSELGRAISYLVSDLSDQKTQQ